MTQSSDGDLVRRARVAKEIETSGLPTQTTHPPTTHTLIPHARAPHPPSHPCALHTERSYVTSLQNLEKLYIQPLVSSTLRELCVDSTAVHFPDSHRTQLETSILGPEDINVIFSSIPNILRLNESFLDELHHRLAVDPHPTNTTTTITTITITNTYTTTPPHHHTTTNTGSICTQPTNPHPSYDTGMVR